MTVIGTNVNSLRAANASNSANMALSSAMERLSTGKRINSAKDDAAGLAISTSMTSQIRGMTQAIRNANDGIALAQTADGALSEVTNMLQRVRELAIQSASGTYSDDDRSNMQTEVTQLTSQINSVLTDTKFNGVTLFQTTSGGTTTDGSSVKIQTGANSSDQVTLDITGVDATNLTSPKTVDGTTTSGGLDVTSVSLATASLANVDDALKAVNTTRASIGAGESRLASVVANLTSNSTNLTDAKSRIEDADFSAETTNLAKAQILSQASTAMLAQANQSQQSVLKLLQ